MLSKTTALLGAVLCAAVCGNGIAVDVPAQYPHVPVLFWSDRATFNGKNAYVSGVFDDKQTATLLTNAVSLDSTTDSRHLLNHDNTPSSRAEALFVFVRKSLGSEQLADLGKTSFVATAVTMATSSLVIPHTTRTSALTTALASTNAPVVSVDNVDAWIKTTASKELLVNAMTDLVVVTIPDKYSLAVADEKIQQATQTLLKASRGLADFALTGDEAEPVFVKDPYTRTRRLASGTTTASSTSGVICDVGYILGTSSTGKAFCFSHYVRMTPQILTALIFGFFFLFLAYVGLSVLHAIQTPLRYPSHGPPKGKEF